jgi:ABC-type Co2+ transport system permease subunit
LFFSASGLVMVAVIVSSRHCNINPDNVATPIAASLGDLITLALLSWIASLLFSAIGKLIAFSPALSPRKLTETVTLLTYISGVPCLNLGWATEYNFFYLL